MVVSECYFLDVGQGTSNVILLGQGRAIVIDSGPSAFVPLALLRRYADQIVALIVSHNDSDHHGGASQILGAYPKAVEQLYFLQDRPVEQIRLYSVAKREYDVGNLLKRPIRLERDDDPRTIFRDEEKDLSLELLYPAMPDNLEAQLQGEPNATSGVLLLRCGTRRVLFPGDASIRVWRRIHARLGKPIRVDVTAVPHHGGSLSPPQHPGEADAEYEQRIRNDQRWLYTAALKTGYAVVSVGTSNSYGHPRATTISALRDANVVVLCTQITRQCHDQLERLRPGVIPPEVPSRSRRTADRTVGGQSRNVACAGTVVTEIGPDEVSVRRVDQHQRAIDALIATGEGHPLCRP